jgi:hypothetical protein
MLVPAAQESDRAPAWRASPSGRFISSSGGTPTSSSGAGALVWPRSASWPIGGAHRPRVGPRPRGPPDPRRRPRSRRRSDPVPSRSSSSSSVGLIPTHPAMQPAHTQAKEPPPVTAVSAPAAANSATAARSDQSGLGCESSRPVAHERGVRRARAPRKGRRAMVVPPASRQSGAASSPKRSTPSVTRLASPVVMRPAPTQLTPSSPRADRRPCRIR